MHYSPHRTVCTRGLTAIEALVSISVFALVSVVISSSAIFFYRSNAYTLEQASAVRSAQKGIDTMIRDVREATYSDQGSFPIISIATSSFSFYSDTDADNSVELIRYFLDDTVLRRGVTNSSGNPPIYTGNPEVISIVSTNVRNAAQAVDIFEYFDNNGTELTNNTQVSDVRYVSLELIVNVNPLRLPNELTMRSSAAIRNLKNVE